MNITTAETLARSLVLKHLESPWSFKWNNRKSALGVCFYGAKMEIQLSKILVPHLSIDEVEDTILHEIAHAIAGYEAAHGPVWKAACIKIGADPSRVYSGDSLKGVIKYKYEIKCHSCNTCVGQNRMNKSKIARLKIGTTHYPCKCGKKRDLYKDGVKIVDGESAYMLYKKTPFGKMEDAIARRKLQGVSLT